MTRPIALVTSDRVQDGPDLRAPPAFDTAGFLDAGTWKAFHGAGDLDAAARAWLMLLAGSVGEPDLSALLLLASGPGEPLRPVAVLPNDQPAGSSLRIAAETAAREGRGVLTGGSGTETIVAHPIFAEASGTGAVAVQFTTTDRQRSVRAMRLLQWGLGHLRDRIRAIELERLGQGAGRSTLALDLLAVALQSETARAAATAVATDLATRLGCERVAIGFRRGNRTVVRVISHTANFGEQMALVRLVGAAMDEAIDQHAVVALPPAGPEEPLATRDHEALSEAQGGAHLLTVPMLAHDRFVGAITFERAKDRPFDAAEVEAMTAVGAALGPVLEDKRLNDRWIATKIGASILSLLKRLIGPTDIALKLGFATVLGLGVFFSLAEGHYQVNAPALVEGMIRRAVVVPTDGFVKEAPARAGDQVKAGQLLAALEDRDLVLERLRWVTERQQRRIEYEKALAERQRANINIIKAQIEQSEAQIRLIDEQLARLQLKAPFDALVVSGDLSQQIGAAVSRGQTLFELAPLDAYRLNLSVDESQIVDVATGQTGQVLFASIPDAPFRFQVEKITPVAETRDGRNVFRVEARLTETSPRLRPGMDGVAKVTVDNRLLAWIWTRSLVNWVKITAWAWVR